MPIIEIEVNCAGSEIKEHHAIGISFLDKMCYQITDHLSGLLCAEHVQLPEVRKQLKDDRYVVEIITCCEPMMGRIEKRLDENYENIQKY